MLMGCMSEAEGAGGARHREDLRGEFAALVAAGRAAAFATASGPTLWVATERLGELRLIFPDGRASPEPPALPVRASDADAALVELCRGRLEASGPVTAAGLANPLGLDATRMQIPLLALEQQGIVMRGRYTDAPAGEEWCERRLLARIHRYTLGRLRAEIEPVSVADYQRFLFRWQGLGRHRREGVESLRAVLHELQGLTPPAIAWEREILPARIEAYDGGLLDELSAAGEIVWWRPGPRGPGRVAGAVAASPIAILPRHELMHWRALGEPGGPAAGLELSSAAETLRRTLAERGALFFVELVSLTGLLRVQVEEALGELVAAGLVTSDAFGGLRACIAPQRDRPSFRSRSRPRRHAVSFDRAGRWALMPLAPAAELAALREGAVEHAAETLLRRYGVVARAVLAREPLSPSWRELVRVYRRWEARGDIRGGRFVEPLGGEQFALNEAVTALRRTRREQDEDEWIVISAADPLNLPAMNGAEKKIAAIGANRIVYRSGVPLAAALGDRIEALRPLDADELEQVRDMLRSPRDGGPSSTLRARMARARH
jgi:ATP-dependent Lhr-like helicase